MWISARFDLLATVLSLAAIWSVVEDHRGARAIAPVLFFLALLSKESAVALPIAAAGYWVFVRARRDRRYAAANRSVARRAGALQCAPEFCRRHFRRRGSGAPAQARRVSRGARRPSSLLAGDRSTRLAGWMRDRRLTIVGAAVAVIALAAAAIAAGGRVGAFAADKFAVAGFAVFNLASPAVDVFERPFYLYPHTTSYWLGGLIAVIVVVDRHSSAVAAAGERPSRLVSRDAAGGDASADLRADGRHAVSLSAVRGRGTDRGGPDCRVPRAMASCGACAHGCVSAGVRRADHAEAARLGVGRDDDA